MRIWTEALGELPCGLAKCVGSHEARFPKAGMEVEAVMALGAGDRCFVSVTRMDAESPPKHLHVREPDERPATFIVRETPRTRMRLDV